MPTNVTSTVVESLVTQGDGVRVGSMVVEMLVAPDVDGTEIPSMVLEVLVSMESNAPSQPGTVGPCRESEPGVRLDWGISGAIGGAHYDFATRALTAEGVVYAPGLDTIESSRVVDLKERLSLRVRTTDDWPERARSAGWLLDGGAAILYLLVTEGGWTRRVPWQRGIIDQVKVDLPGQPIQFVLMPSGVSRQIPEPRHRIDSWTTPQDDASMSGTGYVLFEDGALQPYPLLIGYPGYDEYSQTVSTVVPVPIAQYTTQIIPGAPGPPAQKDGQCPDSLIVVLSSGVIEADAIRYDPGYQDLISTIDGTTTSRITPYSTAIIATAQDKQGQRYTYYDDTQWQVGVLDVPNKEGDPKPLIGLAPLGFYTFAASPATGGGGILYKGKLLHGGADIFDWIVSQWSSIKVDTGRQAASAPALNTYTFDTYINAATDSIDWLTHSILDFLPALIARGDDGVYLAHVPLAPRDVDVVVDLVAGDNCAFVELEVGSSVDVVNELTVSWGVSPDGQMALSRVITSEYRRLVGLPNGIAYSDYRAVGNAIAAASQGVYGPRVATLEIPSTWSLAAAMKIGADRITRDAFPARTLRYTMTTRWWWLSVGDVVRVTDPEMRIRERVCVIVDVIVSLTEITVLLRPRRTADQYL